MTIYQGEGFSEFKLTILRYKRIACGMLGIVKGFKNTNKIQILYIHNDINNTNPNTGGTNKFISFYLQSLATWGERD